MKKKDSVLRVRLPDDEKQEAKRECRAVGVPISEAARRGLRNYIVEMKAARTNSGTPTAARPLQPQRKPLSPVTPTLIPRHREPF